MSRLFRFLIGQHFKLLALLLSMGLIIYIISDMFEKVDIFVEAGANALIMGQYFLLKIPGIISQILPAVFFLATTIMLCLMAKNRELIALHAGGISVYKIMYYTLLISVFWSGIQLTFSQRIGVIGDLAAEQIWEKQVKKYSKADLPIENVWFTEGFNVVHITTLTRAGNGTDITAYTLNPEGSEILQITKAPQSFAINNQWTLYDGTIWNTTDFTLDTFTEYTLNINKDHELLFLTSSTSKPQQLPIQKLTQAIKELQNTGSNVEALQTAWHIKLAYSASLITLTFAAFAILSWKQNMYLCVVVSVFISFIFYVLTMMGESLGENALLSPFFAAWFPHIFVLIFAWLRLFWAYGLLVPSRR